MVHAGHIPAPLPTQQAAHLMHWDPLRLCERACAARAESAGDRKHAGHIPAPLRTAASSDVGARGAHPRTPASLCAGSGDAGQASDHNAWVGHDLDAKVIGWGSFSDDINKIASPGY